MDRHHPPAPLPAPPSIPTTFNVNVQVGGRIEVFHTIAGGVADSGEILKMLKAIMAKEESIMSAISDYSTGVNAHLDRLDAHVDGVKADTTELKRLIAELQASAGKITPEDQALLDQIQARAGSLADKVEAMDNETPPPPPPAEPAPLSPPAP